MKKTRKEVYQSPETTVQEIQTRYSLLQASVMASHQNYGEAIPYTWN